MRSAVLALTVSLVAAPATLGGAWLATSAPEAPAVVAPSTMIEVPTIAAPVFEGGTVAGYFLARIALELGERRGEGAVVPPRVVVTDAVIAHILAHPPLDMAAGTPDAPGPFDRERFGAALTDALAGRLGEVRGLYVTQVDYLSKTEIRDGARARIGGARGEGGDG